MLRNFLIIATRNFLRHRLYSFINVIGLTSGLVCALFIYLWVRDEVKKDKFHTNASHIFHTVANLKLNNGETLTWPITPGPLADALRDNMPEAEFIARTVETNGKLFQYNEKNFLENGFFADPDFFNIFSFKILQGTPAKNPEDVSSVSISERLADKLFHDENPIGKTVKVDKAGDFTITSVFENPSNESSLQFDFILPYAIYKKQRGDGYNWDNFDHPLYLKLTTSSAAIATQKVNEVVKNLTGEEKSNNSFYIQPFTDRYLHTTFENGVPTGGRIEYVKIFSIVAIFIMIIACINFMNMATARSAIRSKEVGVRKVVGANRSSLIFQFISESILISAMAMIFAIVITYMMLPLFNSLVSKTIVIDLTDPTLLLTLLSIILFTGLLAGSYPAFFLSSFNPTKVLKGSSTTNLGGISLRQILIIFQFSLTVILITCSIVIYNQINYIQNKNIGYNRESVLVLNISGDVSKSFEGFKQEALQSPSIKYVSRANQSLVEVLNQNNSVVWPGKPDDSQQFFRTIIADYDYMETMGLQLKEGRFFSQQHADTSSFIVTQHAVDAMGLTDPIGVELSQWGKKGKIVGVVEDFHSRSLHEAMDPIVFLCNPENTGMIFIRFDGTQTQEALAHLSKTYQKHNTGFPFTYTFIEDDFARLYQTEKVTGSLAFVFTIMTVIISGLGLIGLAAYTAERKRKEISIRKTLGASAPGIVRMISRDFLKLSLIAALIGCPISYYVMQQFLNGYAYHTELGWEVFATTVALSMTITLFTVVFQVARAAMANPVDALRSE
ncbi:MAG TPA: ABC transporter permease [Ohtaekwangia sp.]|nr:ABC transporter permease [Ohtaekwangia sp.]